MGLFLFANIHCHCFVEAFTELPVTDKQTQRLPARHRLAFEPQAMEGKKNLLKTKAYSVPRMAEMKALLLLFRGW